ncbi:hypothetical protein Tco_1028236 [Tanacetum coccineum]|uniref:Uncharacterized protein n=1 Tax=Tanacetum coccineum TaxID=301880 RepID=A0ABQ5G0A5_9ASTR
MPEEWRLIGRLTIEYILVLVSPWRLSFSKTESGIRLMLAPRSARAKHSSNSGKSHGTTMRPRIPSVGAWSNRHSFDYQPSYLLEINKIRSNLLVASLERAKRVVLVCEVIVKQVQPLISIELPFGDKIAIEIVLECEGLPTFIYTTGMGLVRVDEMNLAMEKSGFCR